MGNMKTKIALSFLAVIVVVLAGCDSSGKKEAGPRIYGDLDSALTARYGPDYEIIDVPISEHYDSYQLDGGADLIFSPGEKVEGQLVIQNEGTSHRYNISRDPDPVNWIIICGVGASNPGDPNSIVHWFKVTLKTKKSPPFPSALVIVDRSTKKSKM